MGVSVSEGTIVEWRKRPGDWVAYEEPICDISTDKIDTEVPSPAAGRLTEVVVDVGATVEVGTVLARIATDARPGEPHASEHGGDGGTGATPPATSEAAAATGDTPAPATASPAPEPAAAAPSDAPHRRRYSPVVTRMAAEHGIDLTQIEGTGRGGRVRKQDVLAYLENGDAAPAPAEPAPEPPLHIESPYRPEPVAARPADAETAPAAARRCARSAFRRCTWRLFSAVRTAARALMKASRSAVSSIRARSAPRRTCWPASASTSTTDPATSARTCAASSGVSVPEMTGPLVISSCSANVTFSGPSTTGSGADSADALLSPLQPLDARAATSRMPAKGLVFIAVPVKAEGR